MRVSFLQRQRWHLWRVGDAREVGGRILLLQPRAALIKPKPPAQLVHQDGVAEEFEHLLGSDTADGDLVDGEDKLQPMSDDEIVQALVARGVQVARRTVAKYRRELEIPSSYQRRKFTESR